MRLPARMLRRALAVTAMVASVVLVAPMGGTAEAQASGCPSVGTDFAGTGPFSVTVDSGSSNTYYSPSNLGSQGCDAHPVILWGNGTFTSVSTYDALLRHYASHGFIVAAANTSNAGSGTQMLNGLDELTSWNGNSSSRFYQQVDLDNVGATGHSQGGGGAVNAGKDSRVDVIFPLQPWSQNQNGLTATSIFFAGGSDSTVSPSSVRARYDDVEGSLPAAYAELGGAGHFVPVGSGGGYRGPSTAWARWLLMGDADAAGEFVGSGCTLCTSSNWTYVHNDLLADLGNGDPDPGPGDPEEDCVTATNSAHLDAGRATRSFLLYRAAGSGDSLGFSSSATTSVAETSPGHWALVDSC
jgi:hypothetical protein